MYEGVQTEAKESATLHAQGVCMVDLFAVQEGDFGRVEVVKHHHDLVMHAHPYTHFSYWLGGGLVHSRVGSHTVHMGPEMALGVNSHASHDLRLNDASQAAVF